VYYGLYAATFVEVSATKENQSTLAITKIERSHTATVANNPWGTESRDVGERDFCEHFSKKFCCGCPPASENDGDIVVGYARAGSDEFGGLGGTIKSCHAASVEHARKLS
jgi:hypothetical protein